jgi:hypothetical protein
VRESTATVRRRRPVLPATEEDRREAEEAEAMLLESNRRLRRRPEGTIFTDQERAALRARRERDGTALA